jgi:hypothetical protein
MIVTMIAAVLLLWFALSTILGLLIGPLFNHTTCGCWQQNLQRATVRSASQS